MSSFCPCIVPPIEERLVVPLPVLMMGTTSPTPRGPPFRKQLIIPPRLIHARMDIHKQSHKQPHEQRPRHNMTADDFQREVRQQ